MARATRWRNAHDHGSPSSRWSGSRARSSPCGPSARLFGESATARLRLPAQRPWRSSKGASGKHRPPSRPSRGRRRRASRGVASPGAPATQPWLASPLPLAGRKPVGALDTTLHAVRLAFPSPSREVGGMPAVPAALGPRRCPPCAAPWLARPRRTQDPAAEGAGDTGVRGGPQSSVRSTRAAQRRTPSNSHHAP